jgi:hypothetical protein
MAQPKPKAFSQAERKFWDRLRDFIHDGGGWITSEPHTASIRFECCPESDLPELLRARNYDVLGAGSGERLLPLTQVIRQTGSVIRMTTQHVAPATVEIYQFTLPF